MLGSKSTPQERGGTRRPSRVTTSLWFIPRYCLGLVYTLALKGAFAGDAAYMYHVHERHARGRDHGKHRAELIF